jgi:caffeoyl-CoA O-methyltransferase
MQITRIILAALISLPLLQTGQVRAEGAADLQALDRHVTKFLAAKRSSWRDLNVPFKDGRYLRDLIIAKRYKTVIEIGTSTGHSGLWIAWGLSKTGGKLVTFEINARRHRIAVRNFAKARLAKYIDARLVSGRTGILTLKQPIDLVFLDGDREKYRLYFETLSPMLSDRGCFVTHNVGDRFWDVDGYLKMVRSAKWFTTKVIRTTGDAIAITCKIRVS